VKVIVADEEYVKEVSNKVISVLVSVLGEDIYCQGEVDPNIIGGAKLEIGDYILDFSIKRQLSEFENVIGKGLPLSAEA
jgi:F0F1-type ATP synthase delta subunit